MRSEFLVNGKADFVIQTCIEQCERIDQKTRSLTQEISSTHLKIQEARASESFSPEEASKMEFLLGFLVLLISAQGAVNNPIVFMAGGYENSSEIQKETTVYLVELALASLNKEISSKLLNKAWQNLNSNGNFSSL